MSKIEKKLWKKVDRYGPLLRHIPFLRYVAVCNNLSFSNTEEGSDIDLFIIAKKGRLFTARIFITFLLQLLGVRRHGNRIKSRFCLSFFVDDSHLDLSSIAISNDIYLAFWLKYQTPILDDGVSEDFILENTWIKNYFKDDIVFRDDKLFSNKSWIKSLLGFLFGGLLGDFVENFLRKWQINRSKKKAELLKDQSGIMISKNILKFHNNDRRREYRNKWFNNYKVDEELELEKFISL